MKCSNLKKIGFVIVSPAAKLNAFTISKLSTQTSYLSPTPLSLIGTRIPKSNLCNPKMTGRLTGKAQEVAYVGFITIYKNTIVS